MDLVGVTETGRLVVIELKVKQEGQNARGATPLEALMQVLRYAAIAYANWCAIIAEAKEAKEKKRFGAEISDDPPIVQILAPKAWWRGWTVMKEATRKAAGDWEPAFSELIEDMSGRLDIYIECLALTDVGPTDIDYGQPGGKKQSPSLRQVPSLYPVTGSNLQIGEALPPHRSEEER